MMVRWIASLGALLGVGSATAPLPVWQGFTHHEGSYQVAQDYSSGVPNLGLIGTLAGGCSPAGIEANLEMNFEDSTGSSAIDSCTGDVAVVAGDADPDCISAGACPLTDSVSARLIKSSTVASITDATGSTFRTFTVDFTFEYEEDADATEDVFFIGQRDPSAFTSLLYLIASLGRVKITCSDLTSVYGTPLAHSKDVKYNIRVEYDGDDDDSWFYSDLASSGDWGVGGVDTVSCNGSNSAIDTFGYRLQNSGTATHFNFDDVGYCEGTSLGNVKCGRESAVN